MELIIAEKPSLARNIIAGIGQSKFNKKDGYYESNSYIVTWAFGHLFSLIDIEEYDSEYDKEEKHIWTLDNIPFFPQHFRFELKKNPKTKEIDSGIKKQYNIIDSLVNRKDVDTIINAGDSDREGEIIIRLILDKANRHNKMIKRLWLPDQTPETIKSQLESMLNDDEYDNLANEGYARTYIDWLYGVNLTRFASIKSRTLLRVGRVIAPIVKAIYDRDMEIENFIPEKYLSIISKEKTNDELIELISKKTFKIAEKENAQIICNQYNNETAIVKDVKKEKKIISPGKLYSLSKLQGVLGKQYKMSLKESLDIIQSLYESGYVTYPRTNTEYLATAEKDKVKSIINVLSKHGYESLKFKDNYIFNDSKIESHSALTPTTKIPKDTDLNEKQSKVYNTILNRFIAVFCADDCIVNRSTITISVGNLEVFTLKGDILIQKGWTNYDFNAKKDKILPELKIGDTVCTDFKLIEKETTPPKHYTLESLNVFLKNPFKDEKQTDANIEESDDDDYKSMLDGLELGTEATRTGIIENAIKSKYITLKNNTYYIQDEGKFYIETLQELKIVMDKYKTAQIGKLLKDIYKNTATIDDAVAASQKEIEQMMFDKNIVIKQNINSSIGNCPVCGEPLIKFKWGYGCSGYKNGCKFGVSNTIAGKKLSDKNIKTLIENGKTEKISGFISKNKKKFDAYLKVDKVCNSLGQVVEAKIIFEFDSQPRENKKLNIKCPKCNSSLIETNWSWKCENNCGFSVSNNIAGKRLSNQNMIDLITTGTTGELKGFTSKKGKKFNATLKLDENKKIIFVFK